MTLLDFPVLTPAVYRHSDVVVATAWNTAAALGRRLGRRGTPPGAYLLQHHETWGGEEQVNETWRLPLAHIAVSSWLARLSLEIAGVPAYHVPNAVDTATFRIVRDPRTTRPARRDALPHRAVEGIERRHRGAAAGEGALAGADRHPVRHLRAAERPARVDRLLVPGRRGGAPRDLQPQRRVPLPEPRRGFRAAPRRVDGVRRGPRVDGDPRRRRLRPPGRDGAARAAGRARRDGRRDLPPARRPAGASSAGARRRTGGTRGARLGVVGDEARRCAVRHGRREAPELAGWRA